MSTLLEVLSGVVGGIIFVVGYATIATIVTKLAHEKFVANSENALAIRDAAKVVGWTWPISIPIYLGKRAASRIAKRITIRADKIVTFLLGHEEDTEQYDENYTRELERDLGLPQTPLREIPVEPTPAKKIKKARNASSGDDRQRMPNVGWSSGLSSTYVAAGQRMALESGLKAQDNDLKRLDATIQQQKAAINHLQGVVTSVLGAPRNANMPAVQELMDRGIVVDASTAAMLTSRTETLDPEHHGAWKEKERV